jgi:8-oxo-dGTP pyrophosphatase MutT (NUDIX family)
MADDDDRRVQISYGNGGWVRVDSEALPGPLYLRLAQDDAGRWHTREVFIEGEDRHIEAADLRNIPLRALETEILSNGGLSTMTAHARLPGPDLSTLASYYATSFGPAARRTWVTESFRAQLPGGEEIRAPRQRPAAPVTHKPVPPLSAPDEGLTDEFLTHVAAAYRVAVASRKRPGPELAGQAGVPVRTVHRWIYLARLRGLLPPAARNRPAAAEHPSDRPIPVEETLEQPVATAIVTSELGVLVGRRNDGKPPWTFISGEVEPGESPADAAVREVKEETTLEVSAGEVIGERVHPRTGRTMIYLAARPARGTDVFVGDQDELAEVRWVSLAEADELMAEYGMFAAVREYLERELGGA